jgi:hypothetical protein
MTTETIVEMLRHTDWISAVRFFACVFVFLSISTWPLARSRT